MKRFLLFAGDDYYPKGGWGDLKGDFEKIETAIEVAREGFRGYKPQGERGDPKDWDWCHVVDMQEGRLVAHSTTIRSQAHEPKRDIVLVEAA